MQQHVTTALSVLRLRARQWHARHQAYRMAAWVQRHPLSHPARAHIHAATGLGDRAADAITTFAGSWAFVGIHVAWFAIWLASRLDINLLTLVVSLEAIFLATFVLMSQNRTAAKDRTRDDTEADEVGQLFRINQTQLEILHELKALGSPARALPAGMIDQELSEAAAEQMEQVRQGRLGRPTRPDQDLPPMPRSHHKKARP